MLLRVLRAVPVGRASGRTGGSFGTWDLQHTVRCGPQRLQLHLFQVGPRYTADGQLIKHTVLGNPAECVPYCDHSPPSLSVVAVATACDLPARRRRSVRLRCAWRCRWDEARRDAGKPLMKGSLPVSGLRGTGLRGSITFTVPPGADLVRATDSLTHSCASLTVIAGLTLGSSHAPASGCALAPTQIHEHTTDSGRRRRHALMRASQAPHRA